MARRPAFVPKSNIVRRLIASFPFVANSPYTVDLPRDYDLEGLYIELTGTVTLSAAATTVHAQAPAPMIRRFEVFADGSKNFVQTTGLLAAVAGFERKLTRDLTAPGTSAAAHTVYAGYRIDFSTMDSKRPKSSALHTKGEYMSLLQLRTTMGQLSDAYADFGTGAGTTNLTVNVYVREIQEFDPAGSYEARFVKRTSLQQEVFSAANNAAQVIIPVGAYVRGVKFAVLNASGVLSSTLLNRIKLRSGVNVRLDASYAALRAMNKDEFGLQTTQLDNLSGILFADLCPGGMLNQLWDLTRTPQAFLELDVNANATIHMEVIEYVLQPPGRPRGA